MTGRTLLLHLSESYRFDHGRLLKNVKQNVPHPKDGETHVALITVSSHWSNTLVPMCNPEDILSTTYQQQINNISPPNLFVVVYKCQTWYYAKRQTADQPPIYGYNLE